MDIEARFPPLAGSPARVAARRHRAPGQAARGAGTARGCGHWAKVRR